jgi:3-hydroxyacyl-CoA dehydrogenase
MNSVIETRSAQQSLDRDRFLVRKAAVLGAGVMGAQIAAHLVNANVEVLLFELPAKQGDPNANVTKAIDALIKLDPSPLATKAHAACIQAANYEQHLPLLAECDLVIEAIAERVDWKRGLYQQIAPHLAPQAILASNTSGLSIEALAQALPESLRARFCGVHFFNPPRYMHLVELIPAAATRPAILDRLETFLVTTLGKGVIRAKDTPNFIANRVGVFALLATIHHAQRLGLGFEVVDALSGTLVGRPKSATFRTADMVGLDILAHVIDTMRLGLSDDPWHKYFETPAWLRTLIDKGALGQKAKAGVYRKVSGDIQVLDPAAGDYRLAAGKADEKIIEILKLKDPAERLRALRESSHVQAQFLWAMFRDTFHYCAVHLAAIAHSARDLDLAIRWGFGWSQGPFEAWQAAGWQQVAGWIADDIAAGRTMANVPLPAWAGAPGRTGVHAPQASYSPARDAYAPRPALPVYRRQPFPDRVLGEEAKYGETILETDAVRLWHTGDDIAILSFKTKMHTISGDVLDGTLQAIDAAERNYRALVIWQTEAPFSAGANLSKGGGRSGEAKPSVVSKTIKGWKRAATSVALKVAHELNVADKLMANKLAEIEDIVERFQQTSQALKYSMVPTVAAVDGLALGGGCEFVMHSTRAVATLESYIGLVEVGVGLLPAGGGCKEFALRAAGDIKQLQNYFQNAAMAQVSRSAENARELGYLRPTDKVVMNRFELLHVAKAEAIALSEGGYRPPLRARQIPVAGKAGIALFKAAMANMRAGEQISEHDYLIGSKIAHVMSGGEVEPGSLVDEQWLLDLERAAFMELAATQKTQARIEHMLKTGKPLRN